MTHARCMPSRISHSKSAKSRAQLTPVGQENIFTFLVPTTNAMAKFLKFHTQRPPVVRGGQGGKPVSICHQNCVFLLGRSSIDDHPGIHLDLSLGQSRRSVQNCWQRAQFSVSCEIFEEFCMLTYCIFPLCCK